MAQVTGFLERVYKICKFWQLEDINLKTELNSVHLQGEHLACHSAIRYTATCKSRSFHMKLEHSRLFPNQRLITLPRAVFFNHEQVDSKGEFQWCYFYAASTFTMGPQHMATLTAHLKHLCPTQLNCRPTDSTSALPATHSGKRTRFQTRRLKPPFPPGGQCPKARSRPPWCSPSLRILLLPTVWLAQGTRLVLVGHCSAEPGEHPALGPDPPAKVALHQEDGTRRAITGAESGERPQRGRERSRAPAKHP